MESPQKTIVMVGGIVCACMVGKVERRSKTVDVGGHVI